MTTGRAALDVGALAEHVGRRREMFYPKADIAIDDGVLRQLSIHAADEGADDARKALDTALGGEAKDFTLAPLLQQGTYHRVYGASDAEGRRRYVVRLNRLPEAETDWQLFADESVSKALTEAARLKDAHARRIPPCRRFLSDSLWRHRSPVHRQHRRQGAGFPEGQRAGLDDRRIRHAAALDPYSHGP